MKRLHIPTLFRSLILLSAIVGSYGSTRAQDLQFTQYANAPMTINPALTGVFDGVFRATNNYRSQWASAGNGYKTMQFSADAPLGKASLDNRYFGVGLVVVQDKAGLAQFKRTLIEGSLSYSSALDFEARHWISVGFQGGLDNVAADLSGATWDSQWNGDSFDPAYGYSEGVQFPTFTYTNLNAGVNYLYCPDGVNSASGGVSLSHVGSPNVSFYPPGENPYRQRITLHGSGEIALDDFHETFINPRVLMQFQANHKTILVGGYYKKMLRMRSIYTDYMKQMYLNLGAFYRLNESIIFASRFDFYNFNLGLSYDFGMGKLAKLISANSWEVSLGWVAPVQRGKRSKNFNRMPRFL